MNKEQVYKLLKITIIATAFMTFFEAIFAIPGVSEWISEYIHGINNKWLLWLTIWMIMLNQYWKNKIGGCTIFTIQDEPQK